MVAEQNRLSALQVGVAGKIRVAMRITECYENVDQVEAGGRNSLECIQGEESKRRGHLIVATTRRVELRAHIAREFYDATFDRHVDVLVARRPGKSIVRELSEDLIEGGDERRALVVTHEPGAHQAPHVRLRSGNVEGIEHVIIGVTLREVPETATHCGGEPSTPQRHDVGDVAFLAP